jgi:hypothetical protein
VDPSGEFIFTALAAIFAPPLLPLAISADIGLWNGGSLANGTMNPFKWDYGSAKTWGYMLGGALTGAASGGAATAITNSGIAFANTIAIGAASFINSVGTAAYSGGQTDISLGFGFGSYNLSTGKLGYLGKKGNSFMENLGFGIGAFGSASDLQSFLKGAYGNRVNNIKLVSNNHSSLEDIAGNDILNVGADLAALGLDRNNLPISSAFKKFPITTEYNSEPDMFFRKQIIKGARVDKIVQYKSMLDNSDQKFSLLSFIGNDSMNCSLGASRALLSSGVFNIGLGVPGLLSFQMYLRQNLNYSHLFFR